MASTAANNNARSPPSQAVLSSSTSPKSGLSAASLANATEPNSSTFNPQGGSVGTFAPRSIGGSSPTSTAPSAAFPFGQTNLSGQTQGFTFTKSPTSDASAPSFSNQPTGNTFQFSFNNPTANNPPRFSLNSPPSSSNPSASSPQAREPVTSQVFTPSAQKQEPTSNQLPPNIPKQTVTNNISTGPKQFATGRAWADQQPDDEQEEGATITALADNSLLAKKMNTKLRDSNELVVDRNDPSSPLYSTKTFEELNLKPELVKGIYNMGFRTPSKIQEIALPQLIVDPPRNIIAQSQSGTGKTAAFTIAMLSRINPAVHGAQALVLAPTFELALQIGSVIERMAHFLPYIQIAYAVRDPSISKRETRARGKPLPEPIVVGTPGTVDEWCRKLRMIDLQQLRMFVVDEADVMIATHGFQANCEDLVNGINKSHCQMLLFSATYSDEVMEFARKIVHNPVILRLKREKQTLSNIQQFYVKCYDAEQKYHAIENIYAYLDIGQAVVFCRMKRTANDLAVRMANQQHSVRLLTGDLDIEQRANIIQQFRDGNFRVLVSTNVVARGIDIDDVSLVVNYDMPVTQEGKPDYENYLHRIGRCGRFGRTGYTFNLISSEQDFDIMKDIERYFSRTIDEIGIEDIMNLTPNS